MKEPVSRIEKIPSTMVLNRHAYGSDTIFTTMSGPLVNSPLGKCLGVIRRVSYQAPSEYSIWVYEPMYDLWLHIDPDSVSSVDVPSDEGRKYQENLDYK